nr:hypothetical transcript [Hymenolepis microstoma]
MAASNSFAYDSHFHTSFNLNDLETVPNNKPILPNIPPFVLTTEPPIQKTPNPPQPAPATNESASSSTPSVPGNSSETAIEPKKPKKSLWAKVRKELLHYYNGFRLLGVEIRIAAFMCYRLLRGEKLNDRERNQLIRTCVDLVRLVPFLVFIVVPFMEFLLPFYLKFFPFMLPSTFKDKAEEEKKIRNRLESRIKMAKFLQDTIIHTAHLTNLKEAKDLPTIEEFQTFMATVRASGKMARNEDILRFSHLFEDHVTLDALTQAQLEALSSHHYPGFAKRGFVTSSLNPTQSNPINVDDYGAHYPHEYPRMLASSRPPPHSTRRPVYINFPKLERSPTGSEELESGGDILDEESTQPILWSTVPPWSTPLQPYFVSEGGESTFNPPHLPPLPPPPPIPLNSPPPLPPPPRIANQSLDSIPLRTRATSHQFYQHPYPYPHSHQKLYVETGRPSFFTPLNPPDPRLPISYHPHNSHYPHYHLS